MPIERHFLGWESPCLPRAADWLLERWGQPDRGEADLQHALIVLPGRRAARRLQELLVERAERDGLRLVPPAIVTLGALPERVLRLRRRTAGDIARRLAWVAALRVTEADTLRRILPQPPDPGDTLAFAALAEQLDAIHQELAGAGLTFEAVAERGEALPDFAEGPRWRALHEIHRRYTEQLDTLGFADPQHARWEAIEAGRVEPPGPLVLVGTADPNAIQQRIIEACAAHQPVTALVHAPPDFADHFDELGSLVSEPWSDAEVPIAEDQIAIADRPADQAAAVVGAIDELQGELPAEQITLGVCDDRVAPHLQQQLPAFGLPVRHAEGVPAARTRPLRLLAAAADWVGRHRFTDFATLLRHPDVERRLIDHLPKDEADGREDATRESLDDWLTLLDRYYNDHFQLRLTGEWLGHPARREKLARLREGVGELLGALEGKARPLSDWAAPIADVLIRVYGATELDRRDPTHRTVVEACEQLRAVLSELHELEGDSVPEVSAAEALQLVLRIAGNRPIPTDTSEAAIEMLGPLELRLDDAQALILTGFNEGHMPTSVNVDAFLPDALRAHLGLSDNRRRYARDLYALRTILAGRPHVKIIAGRRTAEGDPLMPSRLLFACDRARLSARVRRFTAAGEAGPHTLARRWTPAARSGFLVPPPPQPPDNPLDKLPVTAFKAYLACPYRFYLKYVERLEAIDDAAEELDGGAFGELAHDVLHAFGQHADREATDPKRLTELLNTLLDRHAAQRFGDDPPPALRVQIEQLRYRLRAFAERQAEWAEQGWRIHLVEQKAEGEAAALNVDGEPFYLTGRIDRIDIHEDGRGLAVFDYKTGDNAETPEKAHRRNRKEWVDLQLPLYRRLLPALGFELKRQGVQLGYVRLPRKESDVEFALAGWGDDELRDAEDEAARIVRAIREQRFEEVSRDSSPFDEFAMICGVDQLTTDTNGEAKLEPQMHTDEHG